MQAQVLPNASFESWEKIDLKRAVPEGWTVSPYGCASTDDAYIGDSAISIWSWYFHTPGYLVNGEYNVGLNWSKSGSPISSKPKKLTGYYKLDTVGVTGSDYATVIVYLKKYNSSTKLSDTVAYSLKHLQASEEYIPFEVDISYLQPALDPDTIIVAFFTSENYIPGFESANQYCISGECMYLNLDKLALETTTGISEIDPWFKKSRAYPNPFRGHTNIEFPYIGNESYTFSIYDRLGRMVYAEANISASPYLFFGKDLPAGLYFYELNSSGGELISTGKVTRK